MLEEFKAYDKILNPVVIADESGKIIYINKGVEKLFGYRAYEVLSNNITFLMLNEDAVQHDEYIHNYLTTGVRNLLGRDREIFARRKDKSAIHINIFLNELITDGQRYFIAEITDLSKQREVEKKLEQVSEDWQSVFNSLPQPAALSTLDGIILYVTQAFLDGTGFTKEELIGENITGVDMWLGNNRDIMLSELQKNGYIEREFQFKIKSGKFIDTLYSAKLVEFNGQTCILATLSNISTIKEAENAARKATENFRTLFDNNPSALLIQNKQWKILFVNKAFCELSGYPEEEILGKSAGELGLWVDPAQRQEMLEEFKAKGEVLNKEYKFKIKSGKIYETIFSTQPIELNGEICYFTNVYDNTERKVAAEAIKQAKDNLETILNLNPNTTIITKIKNGEFIYVNQSFVDNLGYKKEEAIGKTVLDLNIWVDIEERKKLFEEIQKNGFTRDKEYRFRTKSDRIITMLYASQIIDLEGEQCLIAVGTDISGKKVLEEALRQSNERFQNFFNNNPEPCSITNMQGDFLYVNESFIRDSGYTRDELTKVNARNDLWVDPKARDAFIQELTQIGYILKKEVQFRLKGVVRDFLYSVQLIENDGEKQLLSMFNEITEIKKKETALAKSNESFQMFFNLNPEPSVITDAQTGKYVYVNEAFAKVSGYSQEFLIGKTVADINGWVRIEDRDELMAELQQTGLVINKLVKLRKNGGDILDTMISAQLLEIDGKKQVLFITRNITEQLKTEEALRQSNEKFQKFFFLNPEPCTITTIDGKYIYVNKAAFEFSGYNEKNTKEISVFDVWADPTERGPILAELKEKGFTLNKEIKFKTKSGEIKNTLYSGQIIDIDGKSHILSITIDITEKKKLEEELIREKQVANEANMAKSEFLANMSHEIRTPMNAIIGTADLLAETELNKEQKHYIDIFQRSGEQLLNLISDVLDLSKIESGHMELEHRSFYLYDVISKACDMIAIKAHTKGLELIYDVTPDVPEYFIGDKTRLAQVIINLAGNALKFTEKGEISISVKKLESPKKNKTKLLFSVKDTGIGIPSDKLGHIFESFAQVDASVTRKYGGTGLGLAICKRICEMMGGGIWVESEPGKGSTFNFKITLDNDPDAPVNTLDLKGRKIGILENNKYIAAIMHRYISSWEADTGVFHNIADLQKKDTVFDILITDLNICEDSNNLRAIRSKTASDEAIIMLLNSNNIQEDLGTLKNSGISRYIIKPVKKPELRELLKKIIDNRFPTDIKKPNKAKSRAVERTVPRSILLVDDSDDNRLLIELYLKKTHYKIDTAVNGNEAIEKVKNNKYAAVLMDVQMPVMDGYMATKLIREWEKKNKHKAVPIIALTANAFKEDEKKSLDAGCTTHLVKPIRKDTLIETLADVIDKK